MVEPAELLVIKDQYEQAFRTLSRGLAAEESQKKDEALDYYKQGRMHLTQGLEVPTTGEKKQGPHWDKARGLQQRMRNTLKTVDAHLFELDTLQVPNGQHQGSLLENLPPDLTKTHHLYPTIPEVTPVHKPPPASPPPPLTTTAAHKHSVPAGPPGNTTTTNPMDQPPAYTPQPPGGHHSLDRSPAGGRLRCGVNTEGDGNQLISISSGVQLFFVAANGQVSSLCRPGFLRIVIFDSQKNEKTAERPTVFLHVCDWLFPLTVDTPVLLANSGIFMFPDTLSEVPGSYAGIVLSSALPPAERDMFQELLSQLADLRIQDPDDANSDVVNLTSKIPLGSKQTASSSPTGENVILLPGWSEKMSQGILSGAAWLSESLAKGAEATGRVVQKSAFKIRDHITPEETPSEVSPHTTRGLQVARTASDGALRVSKFLVNGVSTVAERVANKVAPHVKKHAAKLIPESLKKREEGKPSHLDGTKFVAASSIQGFSTVWSSLEAGAKLVCKNVAAETVSTVTYKYGDDAGQATDSALHSVANVGVTAYNIDNLGFKAIMKTAGKKGAKAMFKSSDGKAEITKTTEQQKQESEAVKEDLEKQEPLAKMTRKD
ncbi:spartin a [Gouania willdenowi]|uniref:MIT domain-containing protein n=1 Tax=Gouania willdenowi TaxID=441366 RepID=A0A8C5N6Y7_GOUWI|nr:spartin [Gouania willdenowi]